MTPTHGPSVHARRPPPARGLLALLALGAALLPAQDKLRVGTWNLEQLGFRAEPPREQADYEKIAAFVREIGVDVLAVQEVGGAAALSKVVRHLPGWSFVLGTSGEFTRDAGQINVGFLWNDARVELLHAQELAFLPRAQDGVPIFHRLPVSASFRARQGGFDFRAITVHLKAGRGELNEKKRSLELAALRDYLRRLQQDAREDQDVLVLGDFNHTYGTAEHSLFTQGDLVRYLTTEPQRPTILHFPEPIDHIALLAGIRDEADARSRTVHDRMASDNRELWRNSYSDHLPVSCLLDTKEDRDPQLVLSVAPGSQPLAPVRSAGIAAAEASATGNPSLAGPLEAGAKVTLRFRDGSAEVDGTLLALPDRWVHLQVGPGQRVAFPFELLAAIVERR
jgi:endonuclease/exonuclease/phosphatase family metal-dependent hydrolase